MSEPIFDSGIFDAASMQQKIAVPKDIVPNYLLKRAFCGRRYHCSLVITIGGNQRSSKVKHRFGKELQGVLARASAAVELV